MDPITTALGTISALATMISKIMEMLNEKAKARLQEEHQEAIQYLNDAINAKYPHHSRSRIVIAKEKLEAFHLSLYTEIEKEMRTKNGN